MGVVKKKYGEVTGFIKENMKLVSDGEEGKRFQVNQEAYNEYLTGKGITKETIKQVQEAQSEYNNATVAVLGDILVEDKDVDRVTINTRTANGVVSTRMTRSVETRTPRTGEQHTKHGLVSIKINMKSRMDRELLDECSKEIQLAMEK